MQEQTKALLWCLLALTLGMVILGCKSPPINYTIQSNVPDIWDAEPKQSVSIKMEFRR
jgi:hypothetical protein